MDVTTETFERDVIERSRELPVVVDFWAAWCGPCRMLGPALEAEAAEAGRAARAGQARRRGRAGARGRYGIQSIPTVAVFRDGEPVTGFVGAHPARVIGDFFDEHVLAGPAGSQRRRGPEAASERRRSADAREGGAEMTSQVRYREFRFPVEVGWDGRSTHHRTRGRQAAAADRDAAGVPRHRSGHVEPRGRVRGRGRVMSGGDDRGARRTRALPLTWSLGQGRRCRRAHGPTADSGSCGSSRRSSLRPTPGTRTRPARSSQRPRTAAWSRSRSTCRCRRPCNPYAVSWRASHACGDGQRGLGPALRRARAGLDERAEPVPRRPRRRRCRPDGRSTSPAVRAATRSGWPSGAGR